MTGSLFTDAASADAPASPGRRQPAPGGLELVRAFLNSADVEAGTDEFASTGGVEAWLRAHDLPATPEPITETERVRLVDVRESIRDLITCRDDGSGEPAPARVLAEIASATPLTVAFEPDGRAVLQPTGAGADRLVGLVFAEIARATVDGTWQRLKVCRNEACRWAYYDASRNRSGQWCTMAVCGNRMKGRALRVRRRAARAAGEGATTSPA